ncbi:hypothetical protein AAFF_G00094350 [Aldrovandia affinis]|uniref:Uncharacterized protein n=1 Tax=Aldrovandia affinis TaxID=143900 RepID=A0AAD7T2X4_9TELE|nr:hypothetical protein AAFF_G00094350 [Aldrovandia affinis]
MYFPVLQTETDKTPEGPQPPPGLIPKKLWWFVASTQEPLKAKSPWDCDITSSAWLLLKQKPGSCSSLTRTRDLSKINS